MAAMMRRMLLSEIHRCTVTQADLHHEGGIAVDGDLIRLAGMLAHEAVQVWNVANGERFESYVVSGPAGSGEIRVNGAAAHRARVGDLLIIATFGWMEERDAQHWEPRRVSVDERNRPVDLGAR